MISTTQTSADLVTDAVDQIVDVSTFVGPWPFRSGIRTDSQSVKQQLQQIGVTHALVSPAQILNFGVDTANAECARAVDGDEFFSFVPIVDPTIPQAMPNVRAGFLKARAVRLLPGPHGYDLTMAVDAVQAAADLDLTVVVQWRMVDVRMAHPQAVFADPTVTEMLQLARSAPRTRLVFAGGLSAELHSLLDAGLPDNVWYDISFAEELGLLTNVGSAAAASRVLCGSHAPIHTPAALAAKCIAEPIEPDDLARLCHRNAEAAGLIAKEEG